MRSRARFNALLGGEFVNVPAAYAGWGIARARTEVVASWPG
jgi:hypothetical protein